MRIDTACRSPTCGSSDGQINVYRMPRKRGYLVDCQADLLSDLNIRFMVPLLPTDHAPPAAVPASELDAQILSLAQHDLMIGNAIDMLVSGF